jgi:hypothetical protein
MGPDPCHTAHHNGDHRQFREAGLIHGRRGPKQKNQRSNSRNEKRGELLRRRLGTPLGIKRGQELESREHAHHCRPHHVAREVAARAEAATEPECAVRERRGCHGV